MSGSFSFSLVTLVVVIGLATLLLTIVAMQQVDKSSCVSLGYKDYTYYNNQKVCLKNNVSELYLKLKSDC